TLPRLGRFPLPERALESRPESFVQVSRARWGRRVGVPSAPPSPNETANYCHHVASGYSGRNPKAGPPGPPTRTNPMLPPFIIEQIRQREREESRRSEQPRLELPLFPPD